MIETAEMTGGVMSVIGVGVGEIVVVGVGVGVGEMRVRKVLFNELARLLD